MELYAILVSGSIGVLTIVITLFMYRQKKRDKKKDEQLEQIIKGVITEKKYMRAAGSLAFHTARAVHAKGICNGEVLAAMNYYKKCEHDFEDCQQETNILNTVKGG